MEEIPLKHTYIDSQSDKENSPCLVMIHGRGEDKDMLLPLSDRIPDDYDVLALQAPDELDNQSGYTWYDIHYPGDAGDVQPDESDLNRSVELIQSTIISASEIYGFDNSEIGWIGFSQGAVLGVSMLFEYPSMINCLAAVHGFLPNFYEGQDFEMTEKVYAFIATGNKDTEIPPRRTKRVATQLSKMNVDTEFNEYDTGHKISDSEAADISSFIDISM